MAGIEPTLPTAPGAKMGFLVKKLQRDFSRGEGLLGSLHPLVKGHVFLEDIYCEMQRWYHTNRNNVEQLRCAVTTAIPLLDHPWENVRALSPSTSQCPTIASAVDADQLRRGDLEGIPLPSQPSRPPHGQLVANSSADQSLSQAGHTGTGEIRGKNQEDSAQPTGGAATLAAQRAQSVSPLTSDNLAPVKTRPPSSDAAPGPRRFTNRTRSDPTHPLRLPRVQIKCPICNRNHLARTKTICAECRYIWRCHLRGEVFKHTCSLGNGP